ncbi:MAG TPA: NTP transferase domain-containing protein [Candidatus Eremiobacteraeota bacterium]|nr:MAG: Bifunctional protein GlmU [bacterium ADurb.Bin363]HPZ06923.1 NTP transferase domain-containing protein [Candidatus Eremiobacteraeota bacterium]
MDNFIAIILAAGKGTRMKSHIPKVLHPLNGKPMLDYVFDFVEQLNFTEKIIVTGDGHEMVENLVGERGKCVLQREQRGTGHAVLQGWDYFAKLSGHVMVLYGDTPLLTVSILRNFIEDYIHSGDDISILTTNLDESSHYGRIIRDKDRILSIVEYRDASCDEKKITEVNTGTYCFRTEVLRRFLPELNSENDQGELYLTDVIGMAVKDGLRVRGFFTRDWQATMGINNRVELALASRILRYRRLEELMMSGVTIIDPDNTYIEPYVNIEKDTVVYPFTSLEGKTIIGENCIIGSFSKIKNSILGKNVVLENSVIINQIIKEGTVIKSFSFN